MNPKLRQIEVDMRTADLLEARAAARGPWSAEVLAEDARRVAEFRRTRDAVPWEEVKEWMQSWGEPVELPPPRPRSL